MACCVCEGSGFLVDKINSLHKSRFCVSFPPTILLGVNPVTTKKKVKQSWGFGRRTQCHSVLVKASLNAEYISGRSADGELLDKEFEFQPSFDGYLKAMESVKTNRVKKETTTHKSEGYHKPNNAPSSSRVDIPTVEGFNGNQIDYQERKYRKPEVQKEKGFEYKGNARAPRSASRYTLEVKESMNGARNYKVDRWERQQTSAGGEKLTDKETRDHSLRIYSGDHKVSQITMRNGKLRRDKEPRTEKTEQVDLERAAFRPLEEVNNVVDKPGLTRNEMEERVQKLARCLNGADIDMPEWMFSKMMRSARIKFSDYSIMRIIQILGKLGNWRRVLQLVEWLQLHDRYKSYKIRHIFTAALNVLGKARRPVEALNLFHVMQQHMATYPDLISYHCIAVTLGQAGHIKELFEVIDIMRSPPKKNFKTGVLEKWDPRLEPDLVVYNAVLNACVRRKQWEGAFWVLQQLKEQGQKPSSTTYGLVMEVMSACGKYQLVHDFFKRIIKSSIPSTLTYKVLVNTLWKEGRTDEAVLVVEDMERRGIVGSAALYYDLARCLCSAGRCHEGLLQIAKSCEVANKPLVVTYTGLIQACLDAGSIQNGVYIFNHMQKFCAPNLVTYNIMLKSYLDHRMFEEAKGLFLKMLDDWRGVGHDGKFMDRVLPDTYTFNAMLDACVTDQRWEDFAFVYKQMLHYGYHFNVKRHLSMIMNAYRAGKKELLDITWLHLEQTGQTPPPLLVKEMFCMKLEQGDCAAAISSVTSHHFGDLQPFTQKAWLNCLKENAHRLQKDAISRLVHQGNIQMSRSESQPQILQDLVTSCTAFLMIHMTSELTEEKRFLS